jgi:hypothetical protein
MLRKLSWVSVLTLLFATALLFHLIACQKDKQDVDQGKDSQAAPAATADATPNLYKAMMCVQETMRHPKEPFHYSFRKKNTDDQDPYLDETDVTLTYIISKNQDGKLTHSVTATPDNVSEWWGAVGMTATLFPTNDLEEVRPTVKLIGTEVIEGYEAQKYDFDTSSLPDDKKLVKRTLFHLKDYNTKGGAWIAKETGCMVKFTLDTTLIDLDGTTTGSHYDGLMSRKLQFAPPAVQAAGH